MPGRFTVGGAMLAVAGVGLVIALGRVHLSLGSFAFGVLGIAWVGTARWAGRRRATGCPPAPGAMMATFLASAVLAAALLVLCLVPAAALLPVMFNARRLHGSPFDGGQSFSFVGASALLALLIVRACRAWPRPGADPAGPLPGAGPARPTIARLMGLVGLAAVGVAAFRVEFVFGCVVVASAWLVRRGWGDRTSRARSPDWPADPARALETGLRTLATVAAIVLIPLAGGAVVLAAITAIGGPTTLGIIPAVASTVGLMVALVRHLWP